MLTSTLRWLALCLTLGVTPAQAATYYLSPSGDDARSCATARTLATPRKTLRAGLTCPGPGDTLALRGGTYTGIDNTVDGVLGPVPSGSSWNAPVTITAYPGETVILRPDDGHSGIALVAPIYNVAYVIFQNLIIDMANQYANPDWTVVKDGVYISAGAHHIRFLNMEVKNNPASGYVCSSNNGMTHHLEFIGGSVHDNDRSPVRLAGYAFYCSTNDNLIDGVDMYANNGGAFQSNSGVGGGLRGIIRNCRIHDNVVRGSITVVGSTGFGIAIIAHDVGSADGWQVYNNLIYHNGQGNEGAGASLGIYVYASNTNTLYANNTIYDNTGDGFFLQYYGSGNQITNNIVYGNGGHPWFDYGGATGGPITFTNNLTTNPVFVNAALGDFRLQTGSAAIDAGVDLRSVGVLTDVAGTLRPQGLGFDIGAFEAAMATALPRTPTGIRITAP